MAGLKLNMVSGLLPRVPESLLPERHATVARNCDFAYGELRNVNDGYALFVISNSPGSLYTDDGLTFFSWTSDVDAVRSPLVADKFNRLYYTGDSGFKVTDRLNQRMGGGPPSSAYLVGTLRPTIAPTLTAVELLPLPKKRYLCSA